MFALLYRLCISSCGDTCSILQQVRICAGMTFVFLWFVLNCSKNCRELRINGVPGRRSSVALLIQLLSFSLADCSLWQKLQSFGKRCLGIVSVDWGWSSCCIRLLWCRPFDGNCVGRAHYWNMCWSLDMAKIKWQSSNGRLHFHAHGDGFGKYRTRVWCSCVFLYGLAISIAYPIQISLRLYDTVCWSMKHNSLVSSPFKFAIRSKWFNNSLKLTILRFIRFPIKAFTNHVTLMLIYLSHTK